MPDSKGGWGDPTTPVLLRACLQDFHLVFHIRPLKSCVKLFIFSAWATPGPYELEVYSPLCRELGISFLLVLKHPLWILKGHDFCMQDIFLLALPGGDD